MSEFDRVLAYLEQAFESLTNVYDPGTPEAGAWWDGSGINIKLASAKAMLDGVAALRRQVKEQPAWSQLDPNWHCQGRAKRLAETIAGAFYTVEELQQMIAQAFSDVICDTIKDTNADHEARVEGMSQMTEAFRAGTKQKIERARLKAAEQMREAAVSVADAPVIVKHKL